MALILCTVLVLYKKERPGLWEILFGIAIGAANFFSSKLFIRHKSIPSGVIDGIRILSIHKSKGLEFPTILIPFCDWKLENERASYIWCSPQESPFDTLNLLPINYGKAMNESIYHHDYIKEKIQLWVDNLNLLYVV